MPIKSPWTLAVVRYACFCLIARFVCTLLNESRLVSSALFSDLRSASQNAATRKRRRQYRASDDRIAVIEFHRVLRRDGGSAPDHPFRSHCSMTASLRPPRQPPTHVIQRMEQKP